MQIFVDLFGLRTVSADVHPLSSFSDLISSLLQSPPLPPSSFYFAFQGRPLPDSGTFSSHHVRSLDTLRLRVRLAGGGGDGGATGAESRDCYLNMYATKKPDKVDPNEARIAKWTRCALSSEALKPPCVIDFLGNIYNKEALVSGLLTKTLPKELKHIKGLKDMITINLASIPGINPSDDISQTKFQCPISGLEFNGKYKFFALRGCGHVLSARALKEMHSSSCLVCFNPYTDKDKIVINGTEEEVLTLRQRMEEEISRRKEKKVKNGEVKEAAFEKNGEVKEAAFDTVHGAGKISIASREIPEVVDVAVEVKSLATGKKRRGEKVDKPLVMEKSKDQKAAQSSKKFKAVDVMPPNATKEVYASIFSSSSKSKIKETFMCRALPLGRN